jgi:hypothetical protein
VPLEFDDLVHQFNQHGQHNCFERQDVVGLIYSHNMLSSASKQLVEDELVLSPQRPPEIGETSLFIENDLGCGWKCTAHFYPLDSVLAVLAYVRIAASNIFFWYE